jgi:hypothetical protein
VGVTTPAGVGRGTFSLSNREGFKLDANYVGVQLGPLGLAPSIDPYAAMRPGNMTASPGDSPDALQRLAPSAPYSGPSVTAQMFEPGTSVGYSHIAVHDTRYTILSVGVSLPKLTTYSPDIAPLPSVLGAVPSSDQLLYGQSLSTSTGKYGVYVGASVSANF